MPQLTNIRVPVLLALLDMFNLPQDLTYSEEGAPSGDISSLDPEEAGFQSSFSKLGASDAGAAEAHADIKDVKLFASKEISRRSQEKPGVVSHACS